VPCTLAALFVPHLVRGSFGASLRSVRTWCVALAPLAIFAAYSWFARHAWLASGEPAITEPPSHFLWNPSRLGAIASLPLVALASALPAGLAVPLAMAAPPLDAGRDRFARAVLITCIASLLIYTVAGVANPRYAMPALTLTPMACAVLAARWSQGLSATARSQRLTRRVAWLALVIMLPAAIGQAAWIEYRREFRTSGREAGLALAEHLPDGAEVWAFEMIDSRPEVLWYAQQAAAAAGRKVRVRWKPYPAVFREQGPPPLPSLGCFVLLRTDQGPRDQYPPEWGEYAKAGLIDRLGPAVFKGTAHNFEFELHQIR